MQPKAQMTFSRGLTRVSLLSIVIEDATDALTLVASLRPLRATPPRGYGVCDTVE